MSQHGKIFVTNGIRVESFFDMFHMTVCVYRE